MYGIPSGIPLHKQTNLSAKGFFYVGGKYAADKNGSHYMFGQMYTEVYVPKDVTQPYPVVLFSGTGQTGTNWMGTPDGRRGWADLFIDRGYVVYVTDTPARGRSAYQLEADGVLNPMTVEMATTLFSSSTGTWPAADRHTQWPKASEDDETMGGLFFDEFFRTQVMWTSVPRTQELVQESGAKLLEKIGPSILIGHSMAGPFPWLIADACPSLVKGIVAIEPLGPPFIDSSGNEKKFGISDIPITYSPPLNAPEWKKKGEPVPDFTEANQWLQEYPAGQLINLVNIPFMIMTCEASYHRQYDELTVSFLRQAGIKKVDHILLHEHGIFGNGHMCMIEKNSANIFALVDVWLKENIQ